MAVRFVPPLSPSAAQLAPPETQATAALSPHGLMHGAYVKLCQGWVALRTERVRPA